MAAVHPNTQLQVFSTPPWEHTTKAPYVDAQFNEGTWEELKRTVAPSKDKIEEAWDDIVDVGQSTWREWMEFGKEKWDSLKLVTDGKIVDAKGKVDKVVPELKAQGQDVLQQGKDALEAGKEKWAAIKAAANEKILDAQEAVKERLDEAVPELKEQGQDILQQGKETVQGVVDASKEKLDDAKEWIGEKLNSLPTMQAGADYATDKLNEATQKAADVIAPAKDWLGEKVDELPTMKDSAGFASEKLEDAKQWVEDKVDNLPTLKESADFAKEKLAEATQKATELGLGVMEPTKEWIEHAADQTGATLSEKMETVVESIKEVMPTPPTRSNDQMNMWRVMNGAQMMHAHATDDAPHPVRVHKSLAEKFEAWMESGAVYQSPAPFDAQCPVLRADQCAPNNRSFTPMPW